MSYYKTGKGFTLACTQNEGFVPCLVGFVINIVIIHITCQSVSSSISLIPS